VYKRRRERSSGPVIAELRHRVTGPTWMDLSSVTIATYVATTSRVNPGREKSLENNTTNRRKQSLESIFSFS
jgi:hypothetical protein